MTNRQSIDNEPRICLDTAELLLLNGCEETQQVSEGELSSSFQVGTKVGAKPDAPAGKST